jgi:hypothetical protein
VVAANPHTIVVLETGGPVSMPWSDKVSGIMEAWFPGIGGGEAIANILFGDVNPSAKLPVTFAKSDADLPHLTINGPAQAAGRGAAGAGAAGGGRGGAALTPEQQQAQAQQQAQQAVTQALQQTTQASEALIQAEQRLAQAQQQAAGATQPAAAEAAAQAVHAALLALQAAQPPAAAAGRGGAGGGGRGTPFDVPYTEKLQVGYKWFDQQNKEPLFPFGAGLSYTTYAYSGLKAAASGHNVSVSVAVKNTGKRAGKEIVQVYATLPASTGEPPKRLIGWEKVQLNPGESKTVNLTIDPLYLSIFNESKDGFEMAGGDYKIWAGASSRNLPLSETVKID